MAGHRNVRTFPVRTTYNININSLSRPSFRQRGGYGGSIFNVGRPMPSQSFMPMMLMGLMPMLNNLFSLIGSFFQPKNVPTTTTPSGTTTTTPSSTTTTTPSSTTTTTPSGTTTTTTDNQSPPVSRGGQGTTDTSNKNYDIDKITEQSYTVRSFDTWWAIVNERYEIPPGVDKNLVARHLAAANSGETDLTKALEMARKGITFKVGDSIKLPAELNIGGQTIKLKENSEAKARNPYSFGHFQYTAQVSQAGEKWFVTQNGEGLKDSDGKVQYFNTKEEAIKYKEQLSQEDSS